MIYLEENERRNISKALFTCLLLEKYKSNKVYGDFIADLIDVINEEFEKYERSVDEKTTNVPKELVS